MCPQAGDKDELAEKVGGRERSKLTFVEPFFLPVLVMKAPPQPIWSSPISSQAPSLSTSSSSSSSTTPSPSPEIIFRILSRTASSPSSSSSSSPPPRFPPPPPPRPFPVPASSRESSVVISDLLCFWVMRSKASRGSREREGSLRDCRWAKPEMLLAFLEVEVAVDRAGLVEEEENTARLGAEEVGRDLAIARRRGRGGKRLGGREAWKLRSKVFAFGLRKIRRSFSGKFGKTEVWSER